MPGPLLTHDELNALVDAALACGFEELNSRSLLFSGMPARYVAGLIRAAIPPQPASLRPGRSEPAAPARRRG
jgi:hypothetical protein